MVLIPNALKTSQQVLFLSFCPNSNTAIAVDVKYGYMHPVVEELLKRLSSGASEVKLADDSGRTLIGVLARVYERARNAMEYRADHLVRRAAIERILKRQLVFRQDPAKVASELMVELRWAKYLTPVEMDQVTQDSLTQILYKYLGSQSAANTPFDWITGVISAEIEEKFNLNTDYRKFTNFAFQAIKQKIKLPQEPHLELLLFIAVDRIYTQSDEAQVAYHLLKLIDPRWPEQTTDSQDVLTAAHKLYALAITHKLLGKLSRFVRRQSPPLVLLRDIYFSAPAEFAALVTAREAFLAKAKDVLETQLGFTRAAIKTAAIRSIVYVFLTKIIIGLLVEVPVDKLLLGHVEYVPLAINLIFPPVLMWLMSSRISLPGDSSKVVLVNKSWQIISAFDTLSADRDALVAPAKRGWIGWYGFFSALYIFVFCLVFYLILNILHKVGFSAASMAMFVFFLSVVAFFAFRIRQTAQVYSYKNDTGLGDTVMLPILAMGVVFNQGLVHLNFLAFIFDFILEAPYKTILRFLDSWVQFLSVKKEEVVG